MGYAGRNRRNGANSNFQEYRQRGLRFRPVSAGPEEARDARPPSTVVRLSLSLQTGCREKLRARHVSVLILFACTAQRDEKARGPAFRLKSLGSNARVAFAAQRSRFLRPAERDCGMTRDWLYRFGCIRFGCIRSSSAYVPSA